MPVEIRPIVMFTLRKEVADAAKNLNELPKSGEAFARLDNAMWALQYAAQRDEQELLMDTRNCAATEFAARLGSLAKERASPAPALALPSTPTKAANKGK